MEESLLDELLEQIWLMKEEGEEALTELGKKFKREDKEEIIFEAKKKKLIDLVDGKVKLTETGEKRAEGIIRRHRLAERLFFELFELSEKSYESSACSFEHILEPEVTESICTFLGHPPVCPHNRPIPAGDCCAKFQKEVKPLVVPLTEFKIGEKGRIVFMTPKHHSRLNRLSALGVFAGNNFHLHQKIPSYVIEVDQTEIALDSEIAKDIFVKKI
jgi:DtxR family Mn-dependent transcriptional regulator